MACLHTLSFEADESERKGPESEEEGEDGYKVGVGGRGKVGIKGGEERRKGRRVRKKERKEIEWDWEIEEE